jgi:tRNA-splicing ligase RtcB
MNEIKLIKLHDYLWEIPKTGHMLVPGRIYASESMIRDIQKDKSLEQVVNVAHLPGIQKYSMGIWIPNRRSCRYGCRRRGDLSWRSGIRY